MVTPHRVAHKRPTSTTVGGRKVPGAPTAVESSVPCLIAPAATLTYPTPFAVIEAQDNLIFVKALKDDGTLRQVQTGDLLIDEDTNDVWKAREPGLLYQNPSGFQAGVRKKHHIEVRVDRADPENKVL